MKKIISLILVLVILVGCTNQDQAYEDNLFYDDLLAVSTDGSSWGYINSKGEVVIDETFDGAGAFYDGKAIVIHDQGYQLIDKNGEYVLNHSYDYLRRCVESGLLIFEDNDLFGLMDEKENIIVEPIYDYFTDFTDGYALVMTPDRLYDFLDPKGNIMNDEPFHFASQFINGYATVKNSDNKAGLINDEFELIIDYTYDDISKVDDYGYVVTVDKNGTLEQDDDIYDLLNVEDLSVVLNDYKYIKFTSVYDVKPSTPLYQIYKDDHYELYLNDGTRFTDDEYAFIVTIGGYLVTYQDAHKVPSEPNQELREYAIFNQDGELIKKASISDSKHVYQGVYGNDVKVYLAITDGDFIDLYSQDETYRVKADDVKGLSDQLIFATKDNLYGAYDFKGDLVIEFNYHYLYQYQDGYIKFSNDGLYGVMNDKYEVIVEAKYAYFHTSYIPRLIIN